MEYLPLLAARRLRLGLLALLLAQAAAQAGTDADIDPRDAQRFEAWRQARHDEVAAFGAMLKTQKLAAVVPLDQLLRSASHWASCHAEPFAVPPPTQWPAVQSTLKLLQHLQDSGVLHGFEVVSAYRGPALNACAGGASQSAHMQAFAVDLVPIDDPDAGARLCRFWHEKGRDWDMGLSRYPSGRVHIDTWRYRSWGADYSGRSSFCASETLAHRR